MKRATRSLLAAAASTLLGAGVFASLVPASPVWAEESPRRAAREVRRNAPLSFQSWVASLPEEQRRRATQRLRSMPPGRRAEFFDRWKRMSEGERNQFTRRMERRIQQRETQAESQHRRGMRERMADMSPSQRRQFRRQLKQWQGLETGEKDKLRRRLRHFRALSPAEQEALVDEQFSSHSSEERSGILEGLRAASSALH